MPCHIFPHADALAAELIARTTDAAAAAIAARGRFVMALTGGSAASTLYPVLAQAPFPWGLTHIVFGDERCVAADHPDSNHRLARETLLSRVQIPEANVHRVRGEDAPASAAAAYEQTLLRVCSGVIDVVHVGMGPDGHICSLFPGHVLLGEAEALVASLTDAPKPPPARVTLTLPALKRARALWFLVAGEAKAEAVRESILDPTSALPAALASRANPESTWLCDEAAGRLLKNS